MSDLYKFASKALRQVVTRRANLRTEVYKLIPKEQSRLLPKTLKLTSLVVKRYNDILEVGVRVGLFDSKLPMVRNNQSKPVYDKSNSALWMKILLAHDYLFNVTGILGGGSLKQSVISALEKEFPKPGMLEKSEDISEKSLEEVSLGKMAKFLRFDTNYCNKECLISELLDQCKVEAVPVESFDNLLRITAQQMSSVLPWLVKKRQAVAIMDLASCLTAKVLEIRPGDLVVDICAAPGSKTLSFLAELQGKGCVLCIERDKSRFRELCRRLSESLYFSEAYDVNTGSFEKAKLEAKDFSDMDKVHMVLLRSKDACMQCLVLKSDFMALDTCSSSLKICICEQRSRCLAYLVSRVLGGLSDSARCLASLDPSCSGSGLLRPEGTKITRARVSKLSAFQVVMLSHACELNCFSHLAYSTCSLFAEENELVVERMLLKHADYSAQAPSLTWISAPIVFAFKENEKNVQSEWSKLYLRTNMECNNCRGFFQALLTKL